MLGADGAERSVGRSETEKRRRGTRLLELELKQSFVYLFAIQIFLVFSSESREQEFVSLVGQPRSLCAVFRICHSHTCIRLFQTVTHFAVLWLFSSSSGKSVAASGTIITVVSGRRRLSPIVHRRQRAGFVSHNCFRPCFRLGRFAQRNSQL